MFYVKGCPSDCKGDTCDQNTGACGCPTGLWGADCEKSKNTKNNSHNHTVLLRLFVSNQ